MCVTSVTLILWLKCLVKSYPSLFITHPNQLSLAADSRARHSNARQINKLQVRVVTDRPQAQQIEQLSIPLRQTYLLLTQKGGIPYELGMRLIEVTSRRLSSYYTLIY